MLLLAGCTVRPHGILSMREMRAVVYDLHRADGVLQVYNVPYAERDSVHSRFYEVVLEKHGVTQAEFDSSLVWYTDNPKRFNKVYAPVLKKLKEELDAYKELNLGVVSEVVVHERYPSISSDSLLMIINYGLPAEWGLEPSSPLPDSLIILGQVE